MKKNMMTHRISRIKQMHHDPLVMDTFRIFIMYVHCAATREALTVTHIPQKNVIKNY